MYSFYLLWGKAVVLLMIVWFYRFNGYYSMFGGNCIPKYGKKGTARPFPCICIWCGLFCLIHVAVILLIITACHVFHPVFVLKVPCYRLFDAFLKHGLGIPADFRLNLIRCDGIASVVSLAVFHIILIISIFCFSLCPPIL